MSMISSLTSSARREAVAQNFTLIKLVKEEIGVVFDNRLSSNKTPTACRESCL